MSKDKLPVWEEVKLAPKGTKPVCFGCPYAGIITQIQRETAQISKKLNKIAKANN